MEKSAEERCDSVLDNRIFKPIRRAQTRSNNTLNSGGSSARNSKHGVVTTLREGAGVLEAQWLGLPARLQCLALKRDRVSSLAVGTALSMPGVGVVITQDDIDGANLIGACRLRTRDLINSVLDPIGYEYPDVGA